MLLLQFGNMNKALTRYNTDLFARLVKLKLAGLFAERPHRWWLRPIDAALRAAVPAYLPHTQAAE